MTKEQKRTAGFAGVALVLVLVAVLTTPRPRAAEVFADQGQAFYPSFTDSQKAAALEVFEFDEFAGAPKGFKVQRLPDGRWTIPSHHDYPADGKDRLAKTAATVMDLKKERIASDNAKDHAELGVLDPQDLKLEGSKGRGKRVRVLDASGAPLADYIFGKPTPEPGRLYVRIPEQKRTYAIKAAPDISVKFEDWVETDLLQVTQPSIRRVVIDKYSFDEDQQSIKNRSTFTLSRDDAAAAWKVSELKEATEEVNSETVNTILQTLSGLKLTGVRQKPAVVAKLKDLGELSKLSREQLMRLAQDLASRGFYVARDGKSGFTIISNEGEEQVNCDDGVVYTLRYGDVIVGTGDEITAGVDEDKKKDPAKKDDPKKDEKKAGTENRYLYVAVRFDESLVGPVPEEPKPYVADPAKKPEEQKAEEEKAKSAKAEWESKKKDWEKKKEDGKKRAEKLTARFAAWYYVIPADAFKKLRVERAQLVKAKEAPKDEKHEHKEGEEKKPEPPKDEPKKPEAPKPPDAPTDGKKPEAPKDEKKTETPKPPDAPKPDEKKPEPPKPEEKK